MFFFEIRLSRHSVCMLSDFSNAAGACGFSRNFFSAAIAISYDRRLALYSLRHGFFEQFLGEFTYNRNELVTLAYRVKNAQLAFVAACNVHAFAH